MGCSDFACRSVIPGIRRLPQYNLIAVSSRDRAKAEKYGQQFQCLGLEGYQRLLEREDIHCVYIPLPTGLHPEWVERALDAGKHLLVEKTFAPDARMAREAVEHARAKKLLLMEKFLFPYHSQTDWFLTQIQAGKIGRCQMFRSLFSIPKLNSGNFRYSAALGGGALLDLGGYVIKASRVFLGEPLTVLNACILEDRDRGVDIGGLIALASPGGPVAQVAFRFDSFYQCSWEFIGDEGKLTTERAFTPPPGFSPTVKFETPGLREEIRLPADDYVQNLLTTFSSTIREHGNFESHYQDVLSQASLMDDVKATASFL